MRRVLVRTGKEVIGAMRELREAELLAIKVAKEASVFGMYDSSVAEVPSVSLYTYLADFSSCYKSFC